MPDFKYAAGGLLAGFGKGLAAQGEMEGAAKRERALAEIRQRNALELEGVRNTNAASREEARDERSFGNEAERDERRHGNRLGELDRASELRMNERRGLLSNTERFVDESGLQWERTREGVKPILGPEGKQLRGVPTGKKSTRSGLDDDGLSASDKRTLDTVLNRYKNPQTNVTDYEGAIAHLKSVGRDDLANFLSGGEGAISYSKALERATSEADERTGFFTSRGKEFPETKGNKEEWITNRAREIMRGDGGSKSPKPQNQGRAESGTSVPLDQGNKRQPKKPAEYPDARWSEKVGAWVVQRNGKWYKVKE